MAAAVVAVSAGLQIITDRDIRISIINGITSPLLMHSRERKMEIRVLFIQHTNEQIKENGENGSEIR